MVKAFKSYLEDFEDRRSNYSMYSMQSMSKSAQALQLLGAPGGHRPKSEHHLDVNNGNQATSTATPNTLSPHLS